MILMSRKRNGKMLGLCKEKQNESSRCQQVTGINDIIEGVITLKWQWAGHIARNRYDRWSKLLLE